ncbi:hypothetical protein HYW46_05650 [Candidatus Daviesbacteria bacterium]|nr:hypothetical protein [Candidatus Daviesbacteria bacterium]
MADENNSEKEEAVRQAEEIFRREKERLQQEGLLTENPIRNLGGLLFDQEIQPNQIKQLTLNDYNEFLEQYYNLTKASSRIKNNTPRATRLAGFQSGQAAILKWILIEWNETDVVEKIEEALEGNIDLKIGELRLKPKDIITPSDIKKLFDEFGYVNRLLKIQESESNQQISSDDFTQTPAYTFSQSKGEAYMLGLILVKLGQEQQTKIISKKAAIDFLSPDSKEKLATRMLAMVKTLKNPE